MPPLPTALTKGLTVTTTVPDDLLNPDRRLGARIAWGPAPSPQMAEMLDRLGTELLVEQDDALILLLGGLMVRVAALTRELAERAA